MVKNEQCRQNMKNEVPMDCVMMICVCHIGIETEKLLNGK
jgi:hypothetical protein